MLEQMDASIWCHFWWWFQSKFHFHTMLIYGLLHVPAVHLRKCLMGLHSYICLLNELYHFCLPLITTLELFSSSYWLYQIKLKWPALKPHDNTVYTSSTVGMTQARKPCSKSKSYLMFNFIKIHIKVTNNILIQMFLNKHLWC